MLVELSLEKTPKDVTPQKRPEEREQGVREGCLRPYCSVHGEFHKKGEQRFRTTTYPALNKTALPWV